MKVSYTCLANFLHDAWTKPREKTVPSQSRVVACEFPLFGLSIIADVVHKSILHAQPNTAQLCFDPITDMDSDPSEISVPVLVDQSQRMSDPYGLSKE